MKTVTEQLFTEDQVEKVSEKILNKCIEEMKTKFSDEFYSSVHEYLFEHYSNANRDIKKDMLKKLSSNFVENPDHFEYKELRQAIFADNKKEILGALTDEVIQDSLERILFEYTHKQKLLDWKWKDGILKFILKNWESLESDEMINAGLLRRIDVLNHQIGLLRSQIDEMNRLATDY